MDGGTTATFVPSTQPSAGAISVSARNQGGWIAAATAANIYIYRFDPYRGFTELHETLASPVGTIEHCEFGKDGDVLFVSGSSSPGCQAYAFDHNSGRGSAYASPSFTVSGIRSISFCNDADIVLLTGTSGSRLQAFKWIPSIGWGENIGSGTGLPARNSVDGWFSELCANGSRYAMRADSSVGFDLAVATESSIGQWKATSLSARCDGVIVLPNLNVAVVGNRSSEDVKSYLLTANSNNPGSTVSSIDSNGYVNTMAYIEDQNALVCSSSGTSPVLAFSVSDTGELTALTDPSTAGTACLDIDVY